MRCGKALEMLLTNRWINAKEAHQTHMVNHVVQRDQLLTTVEETAMEIAALNPMAVQAAKQAIIRGLDMSLDEGLTLERMLASRVQANMGVGV